jgi:hypothetical protein
MIVCVKLWGAIDEIYLNGGVTVTSGRGGLIPLYGGVAKGRGGYDITLESFYYCTHTW